MNYFTVKYIIKYVGAGIYTRPVYKIIIKIIKLSWQNQIFDYKGDIQFFGDSKYFHIGQHGDGLFPVATLDENSKMKMGYISKTGSQVIDPEYVKAYGFLDGKAMVQENEEDNE